MIPVFILLTAWIAVSLWFNRHKFWRRTCMLCCLAGTLMNFAAVATNHGKMPVRAYYNPAKAEDWCHTNEGPNSRLLFLTDVHGTPKFRYSLGDVFLWAAYPLMLVAWWRESR